MIAIEQMIIDGMITKGYANAYQLINNITLSHVFDKNRTFFIKEYKTNNPDGVQKVVNEIVADYDTAFRLSKGVSHNVGKKDYAESIDIYINQHNRNQVTEDEPIDIYVYKHNENQVMEDEPIDIYIYKYNKNQVPVEEPFEVIIFRPKSVEVSI